MEGRLNLSKFQVVNAKFPVNWLFWRWVFCIPQHDGMIQELGVELDDSGNVKASEKTFNTSIQKVFTAGDMRRGQSLVVWAISEGRECARKVDEFLMGSSILESKDDNLIAAFNIY